MRIDCGEEETDERLCSGLRAGDGMAFGTLTTRYWHTIHRSARTCCLRGRRDKMTE